MSKRTPSLTVSRSAADPDPHFSIGNRQLAIPLHHSANPLINPPTCKPTHKLAYADCFAAALAKLKNAELLTGDPEFKALEKEIKMNWLRG
jgi:hypothetical protein